MSDWLWVPLRAVLIIHDRQIARHGGAPGIRDVALLEAGCTRPLQLEHYGEPDVFDLAAAYAFGIAKAHAYVDGNKRSAFVTAFTFLRLNGAAKRPDPLIGVRMMEELASGDISESAFSAWLRGMEISD
ncbi:type II toxin-antitoxin system death-on-curing family toxin [Paracoccus albus]|uniref:type II toxin-antitoxin system death-on-curing family toxin n=1 Tax=Paracoccus albus TaxID=3017784 RepID=UPI0022F0F47E|nr:type II toxin-antitoxin system death-on-curing family toxin [Paracoccus albus]WBU61178.1 type II toxin-antitoxin system death-on-curing family toxin [Paracoccus albus]